MDRPLILIVDDETSNIKLLSKIFSDEYRLRIARNGEEAIVRAKTEPLPDIILLDVMMPVMDGFSVCIALQEDALTRSIPVIFLTAKNETDDVIKGFESGGVDYVTKPFRYAELAARVNTHLELKQSRERIEKQRADLERTAAMHDDVDRMIRHDLKGPLTPILSFPKFIRQESSLSRTSLTQLNIIENSAKKLLELIDLSTMAIKMERGLYIPNLVAINIVEIARSVIFTMAPMLQRGATIDFQVNGNAVSEEDEILVAGEELLCYNMLTNLLKNAAEAALENEEIGLSVRFSESDDQVTIQIRNRKAVPVSIRDRFFDRYATAEKEHGTGLGTFSAKLMTETLNGTIGMSSSEEEGTTVTVRLPSSPTTTN